MGLLRGYREKEETSEDNPMHPQAGVPTASKIPRDGGYFKALQWSGLGGFVLGSASPKSSTGEQEIPRASGHLGGIPNHRSLR